MNSWAYTEVPAQTLGLKMAFYNTNNKPSLKRGRRRHLKLRGRTHSRALKAAKKTRAWRCPSTIVSRMRVRMCSFWTRKKKKNWFNNRLDIRKESLISLSIDQIHYLRAQVFHDKIKMMSHWLLIVQGMDFLIQTRVTQYLKLIFRTFEHLLMDWSITN